MPKLTVLCDLDRTLFDTDAFVKEIWTFAATRYGLDAEAQLERRSQYYDYYEEAYDYRFFDHVSHAAGTTVNVKEFTDEAVKLLSGRFLYNDVTDEVIDIIDALVTFGNSEYQTLKLSLSPTLANSKRHIILEPKAAYIRAAFKSPYVLIDDKPFGNDVSPPSHFIRIDRTGTVIKGVGGNVISDCSELIPLLTRLTSD